MGKVESVEEDVVASVGRVDSTLHGRREARQPGGDGGVGTLTSPSNTFIRCRSSMASRMAGVAGRFRIQPRCGLLHLQAVDSQELGGVGEGREEQRFAGEGQRRDGTDRHEGELLQVAAWEALRVAERLV